MVSSRWTTRGWRSSLPRTMAQQPRRNARNPIRGWGRRWIEHDGDTRDSGCDLLEKLEPLSSQRWLKIAEPSDVTAGLRQAADEAQWVGHSYKHNRNGAGLIHQGGDRGGGNGQDGVWLECNQPSGEGSHAIDLAIRPAIRDPSVAARPPERLKPLPERGDLRLSLRVALSRTHQHADAPRLLGLLCARRERPR